MIIGLKVQRNRVDEIAERLRRLDQVRYVGASTGRVDLIIEVVTRTNQDLASFETVKRFALLPRDFTEEQDELTPTLKPKRRVIAQHFADEIEAMYAMPREAIPTGS